MLEEYAQKRGQLISEIAPTEFGKNIVLSQTEKVVDFKLKKLKEELIASDPECITGDFYDKKEFLMNSKVYEALYEMPKHGIHHLHLTAAAPLKYLIKLTYRDYVYFSRKETILKVAKNGCDEEGYVKCNQLRQYWASPMEFDKYLEREMLLGPTQIESKETNQIW